MAFVYFSKDISLRQWLVAMALFVLCASTASTVWSLLPASPPVRMIGVARGEMMPSGRWRVTRVIDRRFVCGSEIWSRIFRTTGGDRRIPAVASSTGRALEPITVGAAAMVGTHEAWWEYQPVAGLKGAYIVTVSAGWCPNGYSDVEAIYVVPFDWSDVAN